MTDRHCVVCGDFRQNIKIYSALEIVHIFSHFFLKNTELFETELREVVVMIDYLWITGGDDFVVAEVRTEC